MLAPYAFPVSSVNDLLTFFGSQNTYTLIPNAQIWPRHLNLEIGGGDDLIYLVVEDIGTNSGSGFDFILGFAFLQRFYSVYDTTSSRVGFATTQFTDALTN